MAVGEEEEEVSYAGRKEDRKERSVRLTSANTATKFRKALVSGDEALAWQLYEGNPQFREGLDPNASYGEPYQHNTPLHYVCRHAMTRLLR